MNKDEQQCPKCQGLGEITVKDKDFGVQSSGNKVDMPYKIACDLCEGKGKIQTTSELPTTLKGRGF